MNGLCNCVLLKAGHTDPFPPNPSQLSSSSSNSILPELSPERPLGNALHYLSIYIYTFHGQELSIQLLSLFALCHHSAFNRPSICRHHFTCTQACEVATDCPSCFYPSWFLGTGRVTRWTRQPFITGPH